MIKRWLARWLEPEISRLIAVKTAHYVKDQHGQKAYPLNQRRGAW